MIGHSPDHLRKKRALTVNTKWTNMSFASFFPEMRSLTKSGEGPYMLGWYTHDSIGELQPKQKGLSMRGQNRMYAVAGPPFWVHLLLIGPRVTVGFAELRTVVTTARHAEASDLSPTSNGKTACKYWEVRVKIRCQAILFTNCPTGSPIPVIGPIKITPRCRLTRA